MIVVGIAIVFIVVDVVAVVVVVVAVIVVVAVVVVVVVVIDVIVRGRGRHRRLRRRCGCRCREDGGDGGGDVDRRRRCCAWCYHFCFVVSASYGLIATAIVPSLALCALWQEGENDSSTDSSGPTPSILCRGESTVRRDCWSSYSQHVRSHFVA